MIDFSPDAVFDRAANKLKQNPDWRPILSNAVIPALIKSNAEVLAETARYAEYLFKESRWDAAQNNSSILAMANMLGYKPKRKVSARGSIYVSVDPRILQVGKTISSYDFEELIKYTTGTLDRKTKLVFNTPSNNVEINSNWIIKNNKTGVQYVAATTTFEKERYTTPIEIVQGIKKNILVPINTIRTVATASKLDPYLYIPVEIENCENASNTMSKKYFKVSVISSSSAGDVIQYYRVVNTLLLSDNTDYDVEVYNDMYSQNLFYLKFNNDPARGKTLDLTENSSIKYIKIEYLESLGEGGNLLDLFESFTLTPPIASWPTLYGINLAAINAGVNEEPIYAIKKNAPKFYISNYTAGTKEAYENTVLNLDIAVGSTVLRPTKVRVYGGSTTDTNGNTIPLTCISFIAKGLEDLTIPVDTVNPYTAIEDSLNFYLARLKSPQDTLKFVSPNYVPFALGLKCTVSRGETENIEELKGAIRQLVDESWGPNSDLLDFERNFYPLDVQDAIKQKFPEIQNVEVTVEALARLNWSDAERVPTKPSAESNDDDTGAIVHTFRTPFRFNSLFLGTKPDKGFRDVRVGARYVMRIDFLYKKPKALSAMEDLHISLFIQEDAERKVYPFYVMQDSDNYWKFLKGKLVNKKAGDEVKDLPSIYASFSTVPAKLDRSYQYFLRKKVYNDSDFNELINTDSADYISTLKTEQNKLGALSDYLIYFSANYDTSGSTITPGWIELPFDPLYNVLEYFSAYDINLRRKLIDAPRYELRCGTNTVTQFATFTSILNEYVEAFVCMIPEDQILQIGTTQATTNSGSSVLYIDSYDGATTSKNKNNLTAVKQERMISVECNWGQGK